MKIIVFLCVIVIDNLVAEEPWDFKPSPVFKEEETLKENFQKLKVFLAEYASAERKATKEEIQLIDEIYRHGGSSKLAIDAKSYSFASMVRIKDISVWSKELPDLLLGESKQLAGSAIDAVYYIYKKGNKREKLYLLNEQNLENHLNESLSKFEDENFSAKIKKIFNLAEENKGLLDEDGTSQISPNHRLRNEGERPSKTNSHRKQSELKSTQPELEEGRKYSTKLPWVIGAVLLAGILALLLKTFKSKSTS